MKSSYIPFARHKHRKLDLTPLYRADDDTVQPTHTTARAKSIVIARRVHLPKVEKRKKVDIRAEYAELARINTLVAEFEEMKKEIFEHEECARINALVDQFEEIEKQVPGPKAHQAIPFATRFTAVRYPPIVIQPIYEGPPIDLRAEQAECARINELVDQFEEIRVEISRKRSLGDVTDDDAPAAKRARDAL